MAETLKLYGPPGTGKTSALLNIVEQELSGGVRPDRIAFLTFTRAARREAVERATAKFAHLTPKDFPYFKTLHGIAYKLLGATQATLLTNPRDLAGLGEAVGVSFSTGRRALDDDVVALGEDDGDRLLSFDQFRRQHMTDVDGGYRLWSDDGVSYWALLRFCEAYAAWRQAEAVLDFTDLLELVVQGNMALDVDVVIVDEAQDLSRLQWAALDVLSQRARRIYIAGDDDQAIYTWAGACPETFIQRPGTVRVLDQSHRIPASVHRIASRISEGIGVRQPKSFRPRDDEGTVRTLLDSEFVNFDQPGSYLVLYRNHYLARSIEDRVRLEGLNYSRQDMDAPGTQWGRAVVAWDALASGCTVARDDADAVLAAIVPGRGVAADARTRLKAIKTDQPFTLAKLTAEYGVTATGSWDQALNKIMDKDAQFLRAVVRRGGIRALVEEPRVRLSTIHASKGAEADHVVLLTDMSARSQESLDRTEDAERRVWYVGATRARQSLTMVGVDNPLF